MHEHIFGNSILPSTPHLASTPYLVVGYSWYCIYIFYIVFMVEELYLLTRLRI